VLFRQIGLPTEVGLEMVLGFVRCHQLETWFRELVYLEMGAHFGPEKWIKAEEALKRGLKRTGRKRIPADKKFLHMATLESDPLWFISFDSLLAIVCDEQLWPLFETYLIAKRLLEPRLEEIMLIRNRIAHCRSLHADDLNRLQLLLRDLDGGFWRFCISYKDTHPFITTDDRSDPVFQQFADREEVRYMETEPGMNVTVQYSVRPSADAEGARASGKGKLYHFTFSAVDNQRTMDYPQILEHTKAHHGLVAHILLDQFLFVTFPALYGPEQIIKAAEDFYCQCSKFTPPLRGSAGKRRKNKTRTSEDGLKENETANKRFEQIAVRWPHYVVPPSHPYRYLDPERRRSFFGA